MNEVRGGKQLKWSEKDQKPDFWPKDVPFGKVWQDVSIDEGTKRGHLLKVAERIYTYHGYQPGAWIHDIDQV